MKKSILILAGALSLGTLSVQAQVDSKSDTTIHQNYRQEMTKINSNEIPAGLKTTLQDAMYKGWENATFYKSKNGDAYVVEINDAVNKMKSYRFDASGKPMKDN